MSYKEKYTDSINFAEVAYNDKKYDIAVNRYYYGIYQKMLQIMESKKISITYDPNTDNTHSCTIREFKEKVLARTVNGKEKLKIVIRFNSEMEALKKLRHKADYHSDNITEEEIKKAVKKFKLLDTMILI